MQKSTLLFIGLIALPIFFGLKARAQGVAINTDGTTPATMLHVKGGDANSNLFEILRVERIDNNSAGAASIGASQTFFLESTTDGTSVKAGSIDVILDGDATAASPNGSMLFNVVIDNVSTEVMRVDGTAGNVGIGSNAPGALLDVVSGTATGIGERVVVNSLTSGTGFGISSSSTAMTGDLSYILLSGNDVANTGNLLNVSSSQVNSVARGLLVGIASTGNLANSGVLFNFSGNHTGVGFGVTDVTTAGTAVRYTVNSLTSGVGLGVISSSTGLTGDMVNYTLSGNNAANTGNLLTINSSGASSVARALGVTVASTGNLANGGMMFNLTGDHTGFGFVVADVTTAGTAVKYDMNSLTTGTGFAINTNALTSGTGTGIISTSTGLTGNLQLISLTGNNAANTGDLLEISSSGASSVARGLNVALASTGNLATGGVLFNFSGDHTGIGFAHTDATTAGTATQFNANSLTTGTGFALNANALTTGNGLVINSSSTAITDGSLLAVNHTGATAAMATNGIVHIKSDANFTSAVNRGLLAVVANSTTAGTLQLIRANALTTGSALHIASTTTGLTNNLQEIVLTGNNAANNGNLLFLNSSGVASVAKALSVSVASTGNLVGGGVMFDLTGNHTGNGFTLQDVTTAGIGQRIIVNSLTAGTGLEVASTATGLTGKLVNITLTGNNAGNTNAASLLNLNSNGALSTSKALNVYVASSGSLTDGAVYFNFGDAHTGTGFKILDATASGFGMEMVVNSLTNGVGFEMTSATTGLTTGNLMDLNLSGNNAANTGTVLQLQTGGALNTAKALSVTVGSTGNLASGGVFFSFAGAHTGQGFRINDVTTAGTAMQINVNSLVGGKGLQVSSTATGLTGSLAEISLTGDNAGNTNTSNLLFINSPGALSLSHAIRAVVASTGNLASGGVIYEFTGNHTGTGFQVDDVTTTGTAMKMNVNSLTTGDALNVSSTGTGLTSGSLLYVSSATTGAVATDGIVSLNATGNYTSTANKGLLTVLANATQAGTIQRIEGNALTSGRGLSIASSSTGLTGQLADITLSGNGAGNTNAASLLNLTSSGALSVAQALSVNVASTGNLAAGGVHFNFSGAHTAEAFQIDDVTLTGSAMEINVNSLTSGSGLNIYSTATALNGGSLLNIQLDGNNAGNVEASSVVYIESGGALNTANALTVAVGSTGNLTNYGGVNFNFTGAHTGSGFLITDATATGTAIKLNANALTTGDALNIASTSTGLTSGSLIDMSSASTGLTGYLQSITLSGNNAGNTNGAALLALKSTGALSVAKAIDVSMSSTGNLAAGGVLFSFSGAHTGTGFQIDESTATGTGMKVVANSLTSGVGSGVTSTATALTGQLMNLLLTGNNVANTGDLLKIETQGVASIAKAINVVHSSTGNLASGGVYFNFNAAHTGNGFQIDDATATGTAMKMNVNSLGVGGGGLRIASSSTAFQGQLLSLDLTGNNAAMTNGGTMLRLQSTGALVTTRAMEVIMAGTGDYGSGSVSFDFASHTGTGFNITDATATGTGMLLTTNSLTSGTGLSITSTSTALTGNAQSITLSGNNVANTGNLLYLNSSGATSIARAINVSMASTGNLGTGGVILNFNAAHTGSGFGIIDATAAGDAAKISANSLVGGSALTVESSATGLTGNLGVFRLTGNNAGNTGSVVNISSQGALSTAKALNVSVASTGNLTDGGVFFSFGGAHTGNGVNIEDVTTAGNALNIEANSVLGGRGVFVTTNALTSGQGVGVTSSSTAMTGTVLAVNLTGSNAANTGTVLKVGSSGAASVGAVAMFTNGSAGLGLRVNDDGTDTDASPTIIDAAGNVGIGTTSTIYKLDVLGASATEVQTIRRGTQGGGTDAAMGTVYGNPYLLIGGNEWLVNSIQTIGFGYNLNGSVQPAEIGFKTTSIAGDTKGDLVFATRSSTVAGTLPSERMRITDGGFVGIGGTNYVGQAVAGAEQTLTIAASVDNGLNNEASLELVGSCNGSTSSIGRIDFVGLTGPAATSNVARIDVREDAGAGSGFMAFATNNGALTEQMRIIADGNVGIGTTTPDAKLVVRKDDASTNTVLTTAIISRSSSAAVANGIGTRLQFDIEDGGAIAPQASMDVSLLDVTNTSEDAKMDVFLKANGTNTSMLTVQSTNSGANSGVVTIAGGVRTPKIVTKTANYTATVNDYIIVANTTAGGFTITLPAATVGAGQIFIVKCISANDVTMALTGADTMDGGAAVAITITNGSKTFVSDGVSDWITISMN